VGKRNAAFEKRKHKHDKEIKDLSNKIDKEENVMVKSLLISRKNDLILKKNKIIEKAFVINYLGEHFKEVNKEAILANENAFKENLRIRENNSDFCILESKLQSTCLVILFESAREKKMTEVLYSLEEFI